MKKSEFNAIEISSISDRQRTTRETFFASARVECSESEKQFKFCQKTVLDSKRHKRFLLSLAPSSAVIYEISFPKAEAFCSWICNPNIESWFVSIARTHTAALTVTRPKFLVQCEKWKF